MLYLVVERNKEGKKSRIGKKIRGKICGNKYILDCFDLEKEERR